MPHEIVTSASDKMDKSVESFHQELTAIRTGRANASMLDMIEIDVYGSQMKLNQLGTISVPDNTLLVIDLWDKGQIDVVEKAISNCGMGLNPQNDGKVIRVPIPPLSEERRRELVKAAGSHVEEAKIAIRNIRRHAIEDIKKQQKDGEIPEDDAHRLTDEIQKITDGHTKSIDESFKLKEADIMEV